MKNPVRHGLNPTPPDDRDFQLGALITLPKLSELPEEFVLETISLKDQGDTDFCTAFASCLVSEMQEGVELSPEYSFALGKMLSGDVEKWGQDIRKALKPHTKIGALEQKDAPYSLANKDQDFLRRFENWPDILLSKCGFHKKASYAKVTGPYDAYDNTRATIWKFRNEKRGVVSGLYWLWPLDQLLLDDREGQGSGHCIPYIGWTKEGLILQNSFGERAGVKGRHVVSREVVNRFEKVFGAYTLIDLSPEEAQYYLQNGIKLGDNWLMALAKSLWALIKTIFKRT